MANPRILIIGGGAGGLELATSLGNKLGKSGRALITLVDRNPTHIWKPLLHEVATGTLDVDIDQMYVTEKTGEPLTAILDAIKGAAKRGVKVRLLADSKFFATYPETVQELGRLPNIQSATIDFSRLGGIQHAKFFVVDRKRSFIGSANFDWRALNHIHEIGLKIDDARVASQLMSVFERDWNQRTMQGEQKIEAAAAPKPEPTSIPALTDIVVDATPESANPAGMAFSQKVLVDLIASARKSVRIQIYNYSLKGKNGKWTVIDSALRKAASRGARVQLLVDAVALKKSKADLVALAKAPGIEVRIVKIPTWSGGPIDFARLIHSKYMTIDAQASWLGSANWSQEYFTNTRNVGVTTRSPEVTATLNQVFELIWESAYASPVKL